MHSAFPPCRIRPSYSDPAWKRRPVRAKMPHTQESARERCNFHHLSTDDKAPATKSRHDQSQYRHGKGQMMKRYPDILAVHAQILRMSAGSAVRAADTAYRSLLMSPVKECFLHPAPFAPPASETACGLFRPDKKAASPSRLRCLRTRTDTADPAAWSDSDIDKISGYSCFPALSAQDSRPSRSGSHAPYQRRSRRHPRGTAPSRHSIRGKKELSHSQVWNGGYRLPAPDRYRAG